MAKTAILTMTLLAIVGVARPAPAQQRRADVPVPTAAADSKIRVEHDADTLVTTIRISATRGRVGWTDVLRGLARARGSDDEALQGVLPDHRFDVTSPRWQLVLAGLNLALRPNLHFRVEPARAAGGQPQLVIRVDRAALLASKRRLKGLLRNAWLRRRPSRQEYGLKLDEGWDEVPGNKNLVVFVHGLNARPEAAEGLLTAIRNEGFPCAAFRYPNDQSIADSAKLLARQLSDFAKQHPRRGVSLVTHSMGGLVSRAVIEDPELDPGNVRQLIMVAPPNHGSGLARFAFGLELWEQIRSQRRREEAGMFYAWVEDGLSEAATDLRPDSPLLRNLNARHRNPQVGYTIFLGTDAPLSEEELAAMRKTITSAGRGNRWVRLFGAPVHEWLGDLDEVVDGKGDGVVSVSRGRLEGVKDIVVLHFGHVRVLRASAHGDVQKVHQGVLSRLKDRNTKLF